MKLFAIHSKPIQELIKLKPSKPSTETWEGFQPYNIRFNRWNIVSVSCDTKQFVEEEQQKQYLSLAGKQGEGEELQYSYSFTEPILQASLEMVEAFNKSITNRWISPHIATVAAVSAVAAVTSATTFTTTITTSTTTTISTATTTTTVL